MTHHTRFQFDGQRLEPVTWCHTSTPAVMVADSFRVVNGQVVALSDHRQRFKNAVYQQAPELAPVVEDFFDQTISLIPTAGEFFPRWECLDTGHGPTLQFLQREAPDRLTHAILATASVDPRTTPEIKGPDLERLMALRRSVADLGATEAVIVSPEGFIVESAYSSLLVWPEAGKQLWVVDTSLSRISSVTEGAIINLAQSKGITVTGESFRPDDLAGMVVWVVSALHGIREVTQWVNGPEVTRAPEFRQTWQDLLLGTATAVDGKHPAN